jgi:hypothetical protein
MNPISERVTLKLRGDPFDSTGDSNGSGKDALVALRMTPVLQRVTLRV